MKNYNTYSAVEFLQEDTFVRWLQYPDSQEKAVLFWKEWIAAHPDKRPEIDNARSIFKTLSNDDSVVDAAASKIRVWKKLDATLQPATVVNKAPTSGTASPLFRNRSVWMVAASLVLLIGLAIGLSNRQWFGEALPSDMVIVNNQEIVPTTVILPDGSSVKLYPEASISYPRKFTDSVRSITITGEAFFEIAKEKNRPFVVYSDHLISQVMGTSFFVRDQKGEVGATVSVVQGRVKVFINEKNPLSAGNSEDNGKELGNEEALYYNRSTKVLIEQDYQNRIAGLFEFNNVPVMEIFRQLEEFYGISIRIDGTEPSSCFLKASLLDKPLSEKISLICKAIDYSYSVTDNEWILVGNGCDGYRN